MNLVFVAPFAFTPKATVSARMLPMAAALTRRGHHVTILIPPYDNPADSGLRWSQDGVLIENMVLHHRTRLPGLARAMSSAPFALLSLAIQITQRIRQLQPQAIHVFKPVGPGALAMWLLYIRGDRRFMVDNDDWEGHGGWLDVNPYPTLQKHIMAWQEPWCLRRARAITCASDVLYTRTRSITGPQLPVMVVPNGPNAVLHDQVAQAELRRNELRTQFGWTSGPIVIYSGTVPLNHDMDIAVVAVREALSQHATLKWVLVATGDGLPSLHAAIQNAGIEQATEVHGFIPHEQLIERLVAADVAIYPYRDTNINRAKCSGKVIDYMACGKPMVLSDVGMNRVYVEDGKSGLLTKPGDAASFCTALRQLLDNRDAARELGRAAQQRLWEHFDLSKRVGELEEQYALVGK
jgi:glycosyltransferase involved in cell wall biosynthesis